MRHVKSDQRRGITLIEVLVVVFIIGIVVALTLPALQLARETSRRAVCANNLRQLGIALNSYASDHGCIPPGNLNNGYSLHSALLPYLEQKDLYNSINFAIKPFSPEFRLGANHTASMTHVEIFVCPSDGAVPAFRSPTSYAGNMGFGYCENLPYRACNNGVITILSSYPIRPQNITDGMSHTVAITEWLFNPSPPGKKDSKRSVFQLHMAQDSVLGYEASVTACYQSDIARAAVDPDGRGLNWFHGTIATTLYTHALPVNGHSCINGSSTLLGIVTAASQHRGGVNVVCADGHLDFITESVSKSVWRSLGTRSGNDIE